jgi:TatD DNase family protein
MLIDTHCHLTVDELACQADAVLERARAADVRRVITIAENPADARAALDLAGPRPQVFIAAGVHPHKAAEVSQEELNALADLHRGRWEDAQAGERLVAVGETGLDFHYDVAAPQQQEEVFRFQLELACETGRPVVIHAREAEEHVCDILSDYPVLGGRVVGVAVL